MNYYPQPVGPKGGKRDAGKVSPKVQLERDVAQLEHERLMAKYELMNRALDLVGRALEIVRVVSSTVAYAVPLWVVLLMVREVAGKDTNFAFSLQISIAIAFAEAVGLSAQEKRIRNEKNALVALRQRATRLEAALIHAGVPLPEERR